MTKKVLVTDYVWPTTDPEREVIEAGGAELIVSPSGDEDTLIELARDADGIMTCFAKVNGERRARGGALASSSAATASASTTSRWTPPPSLASSSPYVPDYCVDEVSDHVIGLMLGWNRRIVMHNDDTKRNGWGNAGPPVFGSCGCGTRRSASWASDASGAPPRKRPGPSAWRPSPPTPS